MATDKVKRTLAVVTTMTDEERTEFLKEIEKIRTERESVKRILVANEWTKTARAVGWVSSGPTGSGCPYCGK